MKQIGPIKLDGTIDDITFYKQGGKSLARRKPSINPDRFKKDPGYQRSRENSSEFGQAGLVSKVVRRATLYSLKGYNDKEGSNQLTKKLLQIIKFGSGTRGERPFDLVNYKHLLKDFNFRSSVSFDNLFCAPFQLTCSADRNEVTLTVPPFQQGVAVFAPKPTTHFRLTFCIGSVSNYFFKEGEGFKPINPEENGLHAMVRGPVIKNNDSSNPGFSLTAQLENLPVLSNTSSLIATIGIDFIEMINGDQSFYPYKKTMKVLDIF